MQSNKSFNLDKQNHTPRKHYQHHPPQTPPAATAATPTDTCKGQQASSWNEGLTIDLKNFGNQERRPSPNVVVSDITHISEEEMRKLSQGLSVSQSSLSSTSSAHSSLLRVIMTLHDLYYPGL